MKRMFVVIAVALLAGCTAMQPKPIARVPYDASYFSVLPTSGTGVVKGQLFLRTRGGEVKVGAGEQVELNPVTPMSEQWYQIEYLGGNRLAEPDKRYTDHATFVQADAEGRFEFDSVPPGQYFLVGRVLWDIPYGMTQGGYIAKRVTVENDRTQTVMLTR